MKKILFLLIGAGFLLGLSSCKKDGNGNLNINMKLQYQGEPLVMFEDYAYPDGRTINFSRFSMYMTDLTLGDQLLSDIDFYNLSNSHASLEDANKGYTLSFTDLPEGTYETLSFGEGLTPDLNAMTPDQFDSDHPLAKSSEHWFSWASYIFTKAEGNIDMNNDGVDKETAFALHLGADNAYRYFTFTKDINIEKDETTEVDLIIDLYYLFDGEDRIYPIDENPQIHSLNQMEAVDELSNNIENVFYLN